MTERMCDADGTRRHVKISFENGHSTHRAHSRGERAAARQVTAAREAHAISPRVCGVASRRGRRARRRRVRRRRRSRGRRARCPRSRASRAPCTSSTRHNLSCGESRSGAAQKPDPPRTARGCAQRMGAGRMRLCRRAGTTSSRRAAAGASVAIHPYPATALHTRAPRIPLSTGACGSSISSRGSTAPSRNRHTTIGLVVFSKARATGSIRPMRSRTPWKTRSSAPLAARRQQVEMALTLALTLTTDRSGHDRPAL